MPDVTLESLAARVAELELKLADGKAKSPSDWRSMVGIFPDDDLTRSWIAEMEASREADRAEARSNPDGVPS